MDILHFQRLGPLGWGWLGQLSWTSFTSTEYDPLGSGGKLSRTSFTSKEYDPLGCGGENYHGHFFTSKEHHPLSWGRSYHGHPLLPRGTTLQVRKAIMDILHFQRARPLGWGWLGQLSWPSLTSTEYDPVGSGGKLSWTSFTSMEVRPFKLEELSWTSFPSKEYDPLGW